MLVLVLIRQFRLLLARTDTSTWVILRNPEQEHHMIGWGRDEFGRSRMAAVVSVDVLQIYKTILNYILSKFGYIFFCLSP